jgi:hypothetical protein
VTSLLCQPKALERISTVLNRRGIPFAGDI